MSGEKADVRALVAAGRMEQAMEHLYRCYHRDVRRFVRFKGPAEAVDDICQEVWLAVQQGLLRFHFDSSPKAWILSIAAHKVVDSLRRNRRRKEDVEFDSRDIVLAAFAPRPAGPLTKIERQRRREALEAVFASWNPLHRELLELRFVCGLKPAEIVKVLGLQAAPNTISQQIVRLARRLRDDLTQRAPLSTGRRRD